ncbi:protein distal antenna-like [Euwallacea similis]|uniref:protein distal antenna-like n=1 Tax=Euwallacea similis TaxID=1736056 RepID=UPI003450FC84
MSAAKAGKRPLRSLTPQEKLSAIKRVSVGGESKASVARDIGVPESTLRGWCKNQEKISYQVRTSPQSALEESPETASNILPVNKRIKLEEPLEEPFNLSLKGEINSSSDPGSSSGQGSSSVSPNSDGSFNGYAPVKAEPAEPPNSRSKCETVSPATSTKATNHVPTSENLDKNRVELAKLRVELGLNRPEVPDLFGAAFDQYRLICQNLVYAQQRSANANGKLPMENGTNRLNSNGLLTTADKRETSMHNNIDQVPSPYDSVSYWLKQQCMMNANSKLHSPYVANMSLPSTSSMTSATNTATAAPANAMLADAANNQQLRIWNWYHNSSLQAQLQAQMGSQQQQQQILYQQLTKDGDKTNSENANTKEEKPKSSAKTRSVLDNLLLNNNTTVTTAIPAKKDDADLDAHQALNHGEKFLQWLEHCSDPSVTTMQLHTVQSLIKNLKRGSDRRNDSQNRNKLRRK